MQDRIISPRFVPARQALPIYQAIESPTAARVQAWLDEHDPTS